MIFKPVHVFSYICYLIWPRREDHHGIRCIHASFTSLFALEHLHWHWDGGDQYICWVARLPFWPLVMWTIITLFYCTVYFRSEYKYIYVYILSELILLYLKWFRIRSVFVKLFLCLSVLVLLYIIIITHWAFVAQPTFLLFFFLISDL